GSLVAPLPLLLLSAFVEGLDVYRQVHETVSWRGLFALFYIVYPTTLLGFSVWSGLLARYPAVTVAPFTLLVPIVGMLSAALVLGEPLEPWKLGAAALVVSGLCVNLFSWPSSARLRRTGG
ncbi:MAG: EamA family transporter, partial [Pseudomonadota bacterium]|nr:EamA family transporter [Pseudomonadota bacterium]